jgi:radical SAM protein with 4Fe4S-binding SPASM domain
LKTNETLISLKEIKLEVTHDCFLNCVHCSSMSTTKSGLNMDWPIFQRILDEANDMGVNEVAFSGGEPLLWDHIEDGISKSLGYGIHSILYTTGNAPGAENILRNLHSAGLNRVVFSIFGANAAEHEAVTRYEGSFDRTTKIAEYCSGIGLNIEFHFVPLSWNYTTLPEIANLAMKLNIDRISVLRLVPQGRGGDIRDGQLSRSQNIELIKTIQDLRGKGHEIRLGSPYNFLMLRENPQCRSGIDRMTIGPDYRIFPCDAFKHISPQDIRTSSDYLNIKGHSIKECWEKSPYFKTVREYLMGDIAKECSACSTFDNCKSGCMAQKFYAYGGLPKRPDPMCLNYTKIALHKSEERQQPTATPSD